MVLIHPFFGGKSPTGSEGSDSEMINSEIIIGKEVADKLWLFVYPSSSGSDDPLINPVVDPKFSSLVCDKVLVCVAEKDFFKDWGWYYKEELGKSGGKAWWRLWRLQGRAMRSICLTRLVTMLWPCSNEWLVS
ncbi:hypothetical protein ACSBR1_019848 [Camellia fascicularis]